MLLHEVSPPDPFIGRRAQLEWLKRILFSHRHWETPFVIVGPPGSGKTAIIAQFLHLHQDELTGVWQRFSNTGEIDDFLLSFDKDIRDESFSRSRRRGPDDVIVVLDDVGVLDEEALRVVTRRLKNYKRVRAVIITTDRDLNIGKAPKLTLKSFSREDLEDLLRQTKADVSKEVLGQIEIRLANNPSLIHLFAGALRSGGVAELAKLFKAPLYNVTDTIPRGKIISVAKPHLILATSNLMEELKRKPESVFSLTPRKFEEILADLLADQGMEVELTQETRDGGRDIIAHYDTPVGRILCLVDAKKYRKDRTVGVGLVRQLHGTLCDHKATNAMMVTTSTYSPDAHAYQQRHKYQLSLREYNDVMTWIGDYKRKRSGLILPATEEGDD